MQPEASTTRTVEISSSPDSLSPSGQEALERIISGSRWTAVGQVGTQVLRFALSLILARLLSPSEFGLIAMAWVILGFVELFKDLGTISALVQVKTCSVGLLNGVFTLNLLIGAVGYVSTCLAAPVVAHMYDQPKLIAVLRVLALTLLISSAGLAMRALLQRDLKFGRLASIDLVTALINGLMAVGLAACGFGIWSLVVASLVSSLATTVLLWLSCSWRPVVSFRLQQVKGIAQFSLNITGSQIFGYLITQADKVLIGVFLGDVALGIYSMAQRLMETVLAFITAPVSKVLFPAFSRIQDDNPQIGLLYTRACGAIALIAFPLLAGLAILAEPFVVVVLGEKWRPLIPIMGILAIPTVIQALATTVASIYLVKAKAHWLLGWQIVAGILTACSYLAGLRWGITGVATAYAVVIGLLTFPAFAIPFRLIQLPIWKFVRSLIPYLAGVALMMGIVSGVSFLLRSLRAEPFWILLISSAAGAATFLMIMRILKVPALADVAEFFVLRRVPRTRQESASKDEVSR